jgi:hypothetical protein
MPNRLDNVGKTYQELWLKVKPRAISGKNNKLHERDGHFRACRLIQQSRNREIPGALLECKPYLSVSRDVTSAPRLRWIAAEQTENIKKIYLSAFDRVNQWEVAGNMTCSFVADISYCETRRHRRGSVDMFSWPVYTRQSDKLLVNKVTLNWIPSW